MVDVIAVGAGTSTLGRLDPVGEAVEDYSLGIAAETVEEGAVSGEGRVASRMKV